MEITEKRETRSVVDIGGKRVRVVIYGCPDCYPTGDDIDKIMKSLGKGKTKGVLYSIQEHKDTPIYGRWSVIPALRLGMVVEFSTSWKYNPGFSATEKYTGVIAGELDGRWMIDVEGVGRAFIREKHVERIIQDAL